MIRITDFVCRLNDSLIPLNDLLIRLNHLVIRLNDFLNDSLIRLNDFVSRLNDFVSLWRIWSCAETATDCSQCSCQTRCWCRQTSAHYTGTQRSALVACEGANFVQDRDTVISVCEKDWTGLPRGDVRPSIRRVWPFYPSFGCSWWLRHTSDKNCQFWPPEFSSFRSNFLE